MFLLLIPFIFRRFILESSSSSIVILVSITPFFQSSLEPFPRLTLDTCRLLLASTGHAFHRLRTTDFLHHAAAFFSVLSFRELSVSSGTRQLYAKQYDERLW